LFEEIFDLARDLGICEQDESRKTGMFRTLSKSL
jgi:hypothetical protein